ncbi:MAG: exosortase/archaeosortase family protein, partial [Armatimonadota bacterium]
MSTNAIEVTPEGPATARPRPAFWLAVGGLVLLVGVAYWPILYWMWVLWSPSDSYSTGGVLIPVISLYLVWLKKEHLATLPREGSSKGLLVLAIGALLYFVGSWTGLHYAYAFSLIIVVWGLILWLAGKAIAIELLFPVAFLVFMIPLNWIIDIMTLPLRLIAARVAAWLPMALGLRTVIDGTNVTVEGYSLLIDLPCSGLRSLLALMSGAALAAYLAECSLKRKIILFASSLPVAVTANIMRIDLTLLLGKT